MALVLGLAAMLWALGHFLDMPARARWLMILLLYVAVLVAQIIVPDGSPLREALGGSKGEWFLLGFLGLAVWGYSQGLGWLKARVRPENRPEAQEQAGASGTELERNARHIVLREIGGPGQKRLKDSRILVVGAGGLGSPALQ